MPSLTDSLRTAAHKLQDVSPRPDLEARDLLTGVIRHPASWIVLNAHRQLTATQSKRYRSIVERRRSGNPLAYLIGSQPFGGHDFIVTPATLIPRPATELLVESVLAQYGQRSMRFVDIGTGSGCVALTVALARPSWKVIATEPSGPARAVAVRNRRRLNAKIDLLAGADARPIRGRVVDIVFANLPYLNQREANHQSLRFEPPSALIGGGLDGLTIIKQFIQTFPGHPVHVLYLECLPRQVRSISALAKHRWPDVQVTRISGIGRTVRGLRLAWD